jgi:hypothetical protein
MAVQDLVKGELDWHEKMNSNMQSLQKDIDTANENIDGAKEAADAATEAAKGFDKLLEGKLDIPNVTAQLLAGFLYYDEEGNVSLKEVDTIPEEVQIIMREHISIYGGMSDAWETGKGWDIDELMTHVGNGEFSKFAIGDYVPTADGTNKWRIVDKMHYPRWAFSDTYSTDENIAPPHIILMPDRALGTQKYNSSNANSGGYAGSLMPARMTTEYNNLPDNIKKYVTQTRIYENNKAAWAAVYRYMRIPTQCEVFGHLGWSDAYGGGAPCQLALMRNVKHRIKDYWYWLLDPSSANTTSFCAVGDGGSSHAYGASSGGSLRPLIVLTNQQS